MSDREQDRATAERIAGEVYAEWAAREDCCFSRLSHASDKVRDRAIDCVLAGMRHASRRAVKEQEVAEAWDATLTAVSPADGWACRWNSRSGGERAQLLAFAHRSAALSASPVDLDAVRREAARKALTNCAAQTHGLFTAKGWASVSGLSGGVSTVSVSSVVEEFRDREYPAPAPDRVECDQCGQPVEPKERDKDVPNRHTIRGCIRALAARVGGQP